MIAKYFQFQTLSNHLKICIFTYKLFSKKKMGHKREVNVVLKNILELDKYITKEFVLGASKILPYEKYKNHYKALEFSCNGIIWLAGWLAFTWLINSNSLYQMQVNMFFGLILDILFIAIIKSAARRRRPVNISDPYSQKGPDKFSFPSGHASRSVFITYFFLYLYQANSLATLLLSVWATAICLSRILLNRHYILDVLSGIILGIFEGILLGWLWFGQDLAMEIISWISDVRTDDTDDG